MYAERGISGGVAPNLCGYKQSTFESARTFCSCCILRRLLTASILGRCLLFAVLLFIVFQFFSLAGWLTASLLVVSLFSIGAVGSRGTL